MDQSVPANGEEEVTPPTLNLDPALIVVPPRKVEEWECYPLHPLFVERRDNWPYPLRQWDVPEDQLGEDPVPKLIMEAPVLTEVVSSRGRRFKIKKWNPALIKNNATVSVMAKRGGGKTTWVKSTILARARFFRQVVLFTGTPTDAEYADLVPSVSVRVGMDMPFLREVLRDQKRAVRELHQSGVNDRNIKLLLILDDCLSEGFRFQDELNEVFLNGRHEHVEIYVISQDVKGLPPNLSTNTDVAVFGRVRSERDMETIRTKYVNFFKTDDEMMSVIDPVLSSSDYVWVMAVHAYPSIPPTETVFAGELEKFEEGPDWPLVLGDWPLWANKCADELLDHPGGQDALSNPEEWDVIRDHTPGFKLSKYIPRVNQYWGQDNYGAHGKEDARMTKARRTLGAN